METSSEKIINPVRWGLLGTSVGFWVFFMLVVNIITPHRGAEVGLGAVPILAAIVLISAGFLIWISIVAWDALKDRRYRLAYMCGLWVIMLNAAWGTWAMPVVRPYACFVMTASLNARDGCYINKAAYVRDGKVCDRVSNRNKNACFDLSGKFLSDEEYVRVKEVAYKTLLADTAIRVKGVTYPSLAVYVKDGEDRVVGNDLYERIMAGLGRGNTSVYSEGYGMGWGESGRAYTGRKGRWSLSVLMSRSFEVKEVVLDEKLEYGSDIWTSNDAIDQECDAAKRCPDGYTCRTYNGPAFGNEEISRCVVRGDVIAGTCKYYNPENGKDTQCQKGTTCVTLGVFESDPVGGAFAAMGCVPHTYLKRVN